MQHIEPEVTSAAIGQGSGMRVANVMMPMTSRDFEELAALFSEMLRPTAAAVRIPLFLTLDTRFTDDQRGMIADLARTSGIDAWFDLHFVDCGMTEEDSFYHRKYVKGFEKIHNPYGLKSGPNKQFFKSIAAVTQHSRRHRGSVLLMETDVTPLNENWLDTLNAELDRDPDFVVAGSVYKGAHVLPEKVRDHINGAAVYGIEHPDFARYIDLWERALIAVCQIDAGQAYDVAAEWASRNAGQLTEFDRLDDFLNLYKTRSRRIDAIANFAGPTERQRGDVPEYSALKPASLLHLRTDKDTRLAWRRHKAAAEAATSIQSLAVDRDWQFPAITEKHAFQTLARSVSSTPDVGYFAFPWATYIDMRTHKPDQAPRFRALLREKKEALGGLTHVVTVCQHIMLDKVIDEMVEMGITHVFWTHHVREQHDRFRGKPITVLPFPLFPVQIAPQTDTPRRHLFSFVGSHAPKYYLSQSRNHIIEELGRHPRGHVVERKQWHYNTVVYKHQIGKTTRQGEELVDEQRSLEFRQSMSESIFSLCPSGSGPNSIRLWESIAAGAIPVILADTYLPPGPEALWQQAAVFCPESREAIRALPARLEEIAADPDRLAGMRHAMHQLWQLYGPGAFTHDVEVLMLDLAGSPRKPRELGFLEWLASAPRGDAQAWANTVLTTAATHLLLHPDTATAALLGEGPVAAAVAEARVMRGGARFDDLMARTLAAPAVGQRAPVSVHLFGRHRTRTPISYPAFRALMNDRVRTVADPADADILVSGFNIDLKDNAEVLRDARTPLAIISEEPLWDTLWSGGFAERNRKVDLGGETASYTFLNHETSDIFRFASLPYFPLTDSRMPVRYRSLLAAQAGVSAAELLQRWRAMPIPAAFCAEFRMGENYARSFPAQDVYGLSHYRTTVAKTSAQQGIVRMGKGWTTASGPRQALVDWHLDKIATFNQRVRILSAYENTHQKHYISEKIIDAYALGAVPVTFASPDHRLWEFTTPNAVINTFGMDEAAAVKHIASFEPDVFFAEAYLRTQARLLRLLGDHALILAERQRVADAVVAELRTLV